jgi:uncharacterized RDD family membrane protein YckC
MKGRKRASDFILVVVSPLVLAVWVAIAVAVGLKGLGMYLGGLLSAWLLFAFVVPLLTGVMAPGELLDSIRWRLRARTHHEGESLPDVNVVWWESMLPKRDDGDRL